MANLCFTVRDLLRFCDVFPVVADGHSCKDYCIISDEDSDDDVPRITLSFVASDYINLND